MPNGAKRKKPASRSSSLPKTLGESKRGMQSQSIAPSGATSAPVWQSDKNAYSAMGGYGEGRAAVDTPVPAAGVTRLPPRGPVRCLRVVIVSLQCWPRQKLDLTGPSDSIIRGG